MRTPQGSTHENEEKRRGDGGGGEPLVCLKVSDQKILHQGAPHDTAPQPTPPEATTNPLPAAALASDTARAAKNLVSTDSPARSSRPISMALASTSVRPLRQMTPVQPINGPTGPEINKQRIGVKWSDKKPHWPRWTVARLALRKKAKRLRAIVDTYIQTSAVIMYNGICTYCIVYMMRR